MSSFTESMYEAGFNDPHEYVDYLYKKPDISEEYFDQFYLVSKDYYEPFQIMPRFVRKCYEPSCPNCGNDIEIVYEGESESFIKCVGFPACKYQKEILEVKNNPHLSYIIREELNNIQVCPICKNFLKSFKRNNFFYIKCDGFPECSFSRKIKIKRKFY